MDRRNFIKSVGVTSGSLCIGPVLASSTKSYPATVQVDRSSAIHESIQANFGSGFELLNYVEANNHIHANIKDRENHYLVISSDLADWQIYSSTSM